MLLELRESRSGFTMASLRESIASGIRRLSGRRWSLERHNSTFTAYLRMVFRTEIANDA